MVKHYVEIGYPGFFLSETSIREIGSRTFAEFDLPEGAFGFRFYDREEAQIDGEKLQGKPKNYSGWFYRGKAMTLEDVKREMPDAKTLIGNMISNNYNRVVKLDCGQVFPMCDDDLIIEE